MLVHRNKPADCLREPLVDTLPTQCLQLKRGYGACKRGMVDMRKRFRGNQPVSTSVELQAGEGTGQLYAGKGTFPKVKGTDGNEEPEKSD